MASNALRGGDSFEAAVPYAAGITSGQGMQVGAFLFGVAQTSAPQNTVVACDLVGEYALAKEPALAIAQGAKVYWDNTNRRCTTTAAGNITIGIATAAALAADLTVQVLVGHRVPNAAA